MRGVGPVLLACLLAATPVVAQRRQPDTVLSLDADVLGGALSYARATGPGRYWGLDAGIGGSFLSRMVLGLYANAMVGGRRVKVGPRPLVGMFSEGSSVREFGVYLVPLSGRFSFGW